MSFSVARYEPTQAEAWTRFLQGANGGTIFHRLDFLAYHGERFAANEHHLIIRKGESLHGVMPMAIFEIDGRRIARSPYGASLGGPVFVRPQLYHESLEIVRAVQSYLAGEQVAALTLTLPIDACYARPCATFRLGMLEQGFSCINRDISSIVPLDDGIPVAQIVTSRARNMARKAVKSGVHVLHRAPLTDFWAVMDKTFAKHGAKPTHSRAEFQWLLEHHHESIYVDVAYREETPIAGIAYFELNRRVNSSFYFCQDPEAQQVQALSLLVTQGLERSQSDGFRAFDFGTSSVNTKGRPNIFSFKESYGAVGQFRETYHWSDGSAG